jgi:hypothetical protein
MLAACGSGQASEDPSGPVRCDDEALFVVEQSYWIGRIEFIESMYDGFNIDDEYTDWCRDDPHCFEDGDGGIDNVLGNVIYQLFTDNDHDFPVDPQQATLDGDITLLITVREGRTPGGDECRDVILHGGIDVDGDASDNDSGTEPFEVTAGSLVEGGRHPMLDARYRFENTGTVASSPADHDIQSGPLAFAEFPWRLPGGEVLTVRFHSLFIQLSRTGTSIEGMIGGFIIFEDLSRLYSDLVEDELLWSDPETAYSTFFNFTDGDVIEEGPGDVPCESDAMYDESCPRMYSLCEDGWCTHQRGRYEGISFAMSFGAYPCSISR